MFHDEGNVNWSVICPAEGFTRDRHAELVARSLRRLGVTSALVNDRHDITINLDIERDQYSESSVSKPGAARDGKAQRGVVKVSGSAYKLTRQRALHHGTCLLHSRNISHISSYLKSPAQPYLKARGVESVRSPVGNVGLAASDFEQEVHREFLSMYPSDDPSPLEVVGPYCLEIDDIRAGLSELKVSDG